MRRPRLLTSLMAAAALVALASTASPASACEVAPAAFGLTRTDLVVVGTVVAVEALPLPSGEEDGLDSLVGRWAFTLQVDRTLRGRGASPAMTFEVSSRACTYQRVPEMGGRLAVFAERAGGEWRLQFTAYEDEVPGWLQYLRRRTR